MIWWPGWMRRGVMCRGQCLCVGLLSGRSGMLGWPAWMFPCRLLLGGRGFEARPLLGVAQRESAWWLARRPLSSRPVILSLAVALCAFREVAMSEHEFRGAVVLEPVTVARVGTVLAPAPVLHGDAKVCHYDADGRLVGVVEHVDGVLVEPLSLEPGESLWVLLPNGVPSGSVS